MLIRKGIVDQLVMVTQLDAPKYGAPKDEIDQERVSRVDSIVRAF